MLVSGPELAAGWTSGRGQVYRGRSESSQYTSAAESLRAEGVRTTSLCRLYWRGQAIPVTSLQPDGYTAIECEVEEIVPGIQGQLQHQLGGVNPRPVWA